MKVPWIAERVVPRDTVHLADLLRDAGDMPWVPTGGGTRLGRGTPPPGPVRALGLSALDAVVEHAAADLTVTVEAGIPVGRLRGILAERRQWLPCLEGIEAEATVGGLIAADQRGPWAGGWGGARDALLGIAFVDGTGRLARGGGRVVKNVAGYDLMRLLTGSLGEFGVIVEATLKVLPLPPAAGGVLLEAPGPDRTASALDEATRGGWPRGLWRFDRRGGERLLAAFTGVRGDVQSQVSGLRRAWGSEARTLEREELEQWVAGFEGWARPGGEGAGWGGALPAFLGELRTEDAFRGADYVFDLLGGHLWCRGMDDREGIARRREALHRGEGHLHLDVAPAEPPPAAIWGSDPGEEGLLWRRVKIAFDPRARLVSGRLPGGI